jgi:hypothetical protein
MPAFGREAFLQIRLKFALSLRVLFKTWMQPYVARRHAVPKRARPQAGMSGAIHH